MPEGFSWTISGATIIVAIGWFASVAMFLYRRGGLEAASAATVAQIRKDHDGLAADMRQARQTTEAEQQALRLSRDQFREKLEKDREQDRREREQFQVAVNAGLTAANGHMTEFREEAARTYATKQELAALEERTNKGMDRIVDRLEQISGRLETIGDGIMKALVEKRV